MYLPRAMVMARLLSFMLLVSLTLVSQPADAAPAPFTVVNTNPGMTFEAGQQGQALAIITDTKTGLNNSVPIRIGGLDSGTSFNNDVSVGYHTLARSFR